jgi:hypothetical protein
MGIPFMETSAKNATNVEQAFMAMAASIKTRYIRTQLSVGTTLLKSLPVHVVIKLFMVSGWPANRLQEVPGLQQCRSTAGPSTRRHPAARPRFLISFLTSVNFNALILLFACNAFVLFLVN